MNKNNNKNNKLNIGDYIIINNKYIGYIIKVIWNSNGYVVKLENDDEYIDKTLIQYNLLNLDNIQGYMLVTLNDTFTYITLKQMENMLLNYNRNQTYNIIKKINNEYNIFLNKIRVDKNIYPNTKSNIDKISNTDEISNTNEISNTDEILNNIYKIDNFSTYNYQASHEDNYIEYITKMLNELFIDNNKIIWNEDFYIGDSKSFDLLGDENINGIIKKTIILSLEKFESVKIDDEYDLKNTLMYKHLIYNNQIDMLSLGKEFIGIIKKELLKFQENIKLDYSSNLLESTNIFDFLNFKIVGEYIEITSNLNDNNNFKVITPELVHNLTELSNQYSKPIDYDYLSSIILKNKTSSEIMCNGKIIEEALKILSQEYIICFQPKIEILLWTLKRIILSWYSDTKLWDNIFKIKILINLFRARGIKQFNQDNGVQPIIMIIPKYGKKIATKVLSHLSYFFFPYKKIGWEISNPTWFDKLDNLMYYTNGSLQLKKYIRFLTDIKSNFTNPLTVDMTQIFVPNQDNKIEYSIPSVKDNVIQLEVKKYKLLDN